jgi:hypothetical protein
MKLIRFALLGLMVSSIGVFTTQQVRADSTISGPKLVPVAYEKVYVPVGFDDNDNVQIIATGEFAHTCYRQAETKVTVDQTKKVITLEPAAYLYDGLCLQVVLPFERVINLGVLSTGTYSIMQQGNSKVMGKLVIKRALRAEPDDYLYAPITQAYLHGEGARSEVRLTGFFPSTCMSMQEVKVDVQSDVIVVQPIAQMAQRADCKAAHVPFEQLINVDIQKPGKYLLHVRSMNGNAVNQMVDVL